MDSNRLLPEPRNDQLIVSQPEPQPVLYRPDYFEGPEYIENEESDIKQVLEYARALLQRKWFILAAALFCFFLAIVISLLQTPLYQAHTSIEIEARHEKALSDQGMSSNEALSDVQTQAQLLQSAALVERVAEKLDPHPAYNPGKKPTMDTKVPDPGRGVATSGAPQLGSSQAQVEIRPKPKRPAPSIWKRLKGQFRLPKKLPPEEEALQTVIKNLEVTPQKDSRIIDIVSSSPDPELAALFLNTLVSEYMKQIIEDRWQAYQQTGQWLTQAHEELKSKLEKSEEKLQAYARASGLLMTGENQNVAEDKFKQLQDELLRAQADRIVKESLYNIAISSPVDSLPDQMVSGLFKDYLNRLAELRRQEAELTSTLTSAHPKVKKVHAQMKELEDSLTRERANLVARAKNDFQAVANREKMLLERYNSQAGVVTDQSEKMIQFKMLKQEAESNRKIYEDTLQKGKEASLESALQATNVRVVDAAESSFFPYKPNILLNSLVGLFAGLFMSVAYVLLRHLLNRSFQAPGATSRLLHVPELGVVPSSRIDPILEGRGLLAKFSPAVENIRRLGSYAGFPRRLTTETPLVAGMELASWRHKPSLVAEHFRNVMASILAHGQQQGLPRAIVVTSPSPGEGKTTVICNLATALAEIGKRVALVDADLRRPRLHRVFDRANTWGLCNILSESVSIDSYPLETLVRMTDIPRLFLVTSGPISTITSNMLYSSRIRELLDRLKENFDIVLIDTPPALQLADSRVVSKNVDGVILVIRAGKTQQESALAAIQRFRDDGALILGTILNDWDPKNTATASYHYDYSYYEEVNHS